MESRCHFNTSELEFLPSSTNSSMLQVIRWMNFCRTVYVDKCNVHSLTPRPRDISAMFDNATYDDCFNTRNLIAYCVSIILSSAIILTNTVILVVFLRYRGLLTCSNIPILSLALSDFLTGVTFTYSTTWNLVTLSAGYTFDIQLTMSYIRQRTNYYLCLTLDGTGILFACMMSSVLSLGVIAVERHIGVFYPFKYPYWITRPRMVAAITSVWVVSLTVGALPLFGWNNWDNRCQLVEVMDYSYIILWTTICFISGIIILYIYMRIFFLSRKHSRQIAAIQISSCSTSQPSTSEVVTVASLPRHPSDDLSANHKKQTGEPEVATGNIHLSIEVPKKKETDIQSDTLVPKSPDTVDPITKPGRRHRPRHRTSRRAVVTTAMILGAFYLSWTPLLVFLLAYHSVTMNLTAYYLAVVTQLNSIFNPVVYGMRNPEIKEALKKLFRCRN